jgi:hypothetical protein
MPPGALRTELTVLGPLDVLDDRHPLEQGRAAFLRLRANEVVSTDRLAQTLWPGERTRGPGSDADRRREGHALSPPADALPRRDVDVARSLRSGRATEEELVPGA